MATPRSKDLAKAADDAVIAQAVMFTVVRFIGRTGPVTGPLKRSDLWDRFEFPVSDDVNRDAALAAARSKRDELGNDDHGRVPQIYAVGPGNVTVHVG